MAASGISRFNSKIKILEYRVEDLETDLQIYRNQDLQTDARIKKITR